MTQADPDRLARELFVRGTLPAMPGEQAARLAEVLKPEDAPQGTLLFKIGETSERVYFVIEGRLVMEREGEPDWEFGPRSIVGVIDLMLGRQRQRNCRAVLDSRLLVARGKDWLDMLEDDALTTRGAVTAFARQVQALWQTLGPDLPQPDIVRIDLPREPLPLYERMLILRDSALLKQAGIQAVASLAEIADEVRLKAGDSVFPEGGADGMLQFVADGIVELRHAGNRIRILQSAGSVVAGAAVFSRDVQGYAARAVTDAVLLRIRDEDFFDQAEEHFGLTRAALAYLVGEREPLLKLRPPRG